MNEQKHEIAIECEIDLDASNYPADIKRCLVCGAAAEVCECRNDL